MPVDSKHPKYSSEAPKWRLVRDCIDGEFAIKAAGTIYLPKLTNQKEQKYRAYRDRAMFYGATGRTLQGLLGAIFRKPPAWTVPKRIEAMIADVDMAGTAATTFAVRLVEDILATGHPGVLVDMPAGGGRPYFAFYAAEAITNWRTRVVNSVVMLDQVILQESVETPATDGFGSETSIRYRVLELDEANFYRQRTFTKQGSGDWVASDPVEPKVRGARISYIPFCFFGPSDLAPDPQNSPLLALASVNVSHYRTTADLEHGAHWTALPTPWVSGMEDQTKKLSIGSEEAWNLPQGGEAGMLEFQGAGLAALERRLESKERLMVKLGARLLEDQKMAAETEESKRLDYSGENSILGAVANTASMGLTKCLNWAAEWEGVAGQEVSAKLNTDFFDKAMDPALIRELVAAWQAGAMSRATMLWNLERGEMLKPGSDAEAEADAIDAEGPTFTRDDLVDLPPGAQRVAAE